MFIHDPIILLIVVALYNYAETMKFLPLLLVPALVAAQDITISKVQYSGNGCPQGTVSTSISSDKTVSLSCSSMLNVYDWCLHSIMQLHLDHESLKPFAGPLWVEI